MENWLDAYQVYYYENEKSKITLKINHNDFEVFITKRLTRQADYFYVRNLKITSDKIGAL